MFKFLRLASKIIKDSNSTISDSFMNEKYFRLFQNCLNLPYPVQLIDFNIQINEIETDISALFYRNDNCIDISVDGIFISSKCFDILSINDYDDMELLLLIRNLSDEFLFKDKEDILKFILESENV